MGLETATYINGLVTTNPTSSDPKSQGDDHLRLVKSTVKATFPNITGAVTPTQTDLNVLLGSGTTPTLGGAVYGTGSAYAATAAGTTGQVLTSNGAGAPTWQTSSGSSGLKNRIINGAMTIDQRNGGAAVTLTTGTGGYSLDRFYINNTTPQSVSIQQVADGPTIAQAGFYIPNCLSVTASTGSTPVAGTVGLIQHHIEGGNVTDLGFGQTGARTITVSFWVKATVTGTYCITLTNGAINRFYSSEYTISTTNTWEKKTITIAGDTTGTWLYNTGRGLSCAFVMAAGSTYNGGTNNTWVSTALAFSTANQVNALATTSNVFRITGVQLELGSVATPFEQRPYGMELALCQRYLPVLTSGTYASGYCISTTQAYVMPSLQVYPRVAPTGITTTVSGNLYSGTTAIALTAITYTGASSNTIILTGTVASGLTLGDGTMLYTANPIFLTGCEL